MDFLNDINKDSEKPAELDSTRVSKDKYSLYQEWLSLKKIEEDAYNQRTQIIEPQILQALHVNSNPINKSMSQTVKDQIFSVNIKRNIAHKVIDFEQLELVFVDAPELKPYSVKPSISASKLEVLETKNPALYKQACRLIEAKENKATVSISILEV